VSQVQGEVHGLPEPEEKEKEDPKIDSNIKALLEESKRDFSTAYESVTKEVDEEFFQILKTIGGCSKAALGGGLKTAVFAGKNLYKLLEFATASKLNLLIVLGICGAAYKNCPYAAYVFDFLISSTLPAIKFLGRVTGFNDGIINLFKLLGSALGIDKLIELLEAIKAAIPSAEAIQEIIDNAKEQAIAAVGEGVEQLTTEAKEAAKAAAGVAAAAKARDLIIESMFNKIPVETTGVAERLLNAVVGGAASGMSQVGVRTIIGAALNAAHPGLPALTGGRKKRRRTMRHKKRNQTKRRVKHGKRHQTKKRQNKRTKSRTKQ
jgi:hypothetical protein